MKPKTVVLMGVAIFCGLIAAFLVSMATRANPGPEMVKVLVAAKELRHGTVLNNFEEQFETREMPPNAVPVGALLEKKQLEKMQVLRTLGQGAVPTQGAVGPYEGLDSQLPKGHRAITIRVGMDTAVAGFILPGARVDLLCNASSNNGKKKLSKIFMQNMLVLAVNISDVRDEKSRTVGNPSTVTLAVMPKDAERLNAVVGQSAEVRLVLRKPDDITRYKTNGTTDPLEDRASDDPESDVDALVANTRIAPNTAVTDENFEELFSMKKLPKSLVPEGAVSDAKVVKTAKFVYSRLSKGQVLTTDNLAKPDQAEKVDTVVPPAEKRHVQRIHNGQLPVIEVVYKGAEGSPTTPLQPGGVPPGSEGKAPGSEGK